MNQCLNDYCQSNLFLQYVQEDRSLVKRPSASVIKLPDGTVCRVNSEQKTTKYAGRKGFMWRKKMLSLWYKRIILNCIPVIQQGLALLCIMGLRGLCDNWFTLSKILNDRHDHQAVNSRGVFVLSLLYWLVIHPCCCAWIQPLNLPFG